MGTLLFRHTVMWKNSIKNDFLNLSIKKSLMHRFFLNTLVDMFFQLGKRENEIW